MRTFFLALAVLAPLSLASVSVASAGERMSDVEYLQAARCAAYLGADAGALGNLVKEQSSRREPLIVERAEATADQVTRKVRRAKSESARAVIDAERSASCASVRAAEVPAKTEPKG